MPNCLSAKLSLHQWLGGSVKNGNGVAIKAAGGANNLSNRVITDQLRSVKGISQHTVSWLNSSVTLLVS